MRKEISYFIYSLLLIVLIACNNDETCRSDRFIVMSVGFSKDTVNINTGDTVKLPLVFTSISAQGIKKGNIMIDSTIKINSNSTIKLPLNQFEQQSTFALKFNNVINDTLTIFHTHKNVYLSLECGTIRVHHIDSIKNKNNYFYKINIEKPDVNVTTTNANIKNISIHRFER